MNLVRRIVLCLPLVVVIQSLASTPNLVPLRSEEFGRQSLLARPSFQLLDPGAFRMQQSYTMSYSAGNSGSKTSGLYLNTLSYQFGIPLVLSMDLGVYNLFQSSFAQDPAFAGSSDPRTGKPLFLLPRIGLEYQPTENITMSLQLLNYPDAMQAYGNPLYGGGSAFGSRRFIRAGDR